MRFSVPINIIFSDLVHFLAFGFGAGLSPKAPGTVGTLVALPFVVLLMQSSLLVYLGVVLALGLLGIFLCGESARRLNVHDHPGIVWDEFVGMAITMIAVPFTWQNLFLGFVLFRIFDISKPWPIRGIDKSVSGGVGIMLDDVIAGVFSCLLLHVLIFLM